jgi:cell division protease FtsH
MLVDLMKNQSKSEVSVNVSSSRMTYGRFLEYLEMGWVKQVDLYDNSRNAIVQALVQSLKSTSVNPSGNTYGCFTTYPKLKNTIFLCSSSSTKSIFITIASNLLPVIFIGSLIFFSKFRIFHLVEDNHQ